MDGINAGHIQENLPDSEKINCVCLEILSHGSTMEMKNEQRSTWLLEDGELEHGFQIWRVASFK